VGATELIAPSPDDRISARFVDRCRLDSNFFLLIVALIGSESSWDLYRRLSAAFRPISRFRPPHGFSASSDFPLSNSLNNQAASDSRTVVGIRGILPPLP
jgi:hypothetical protein